MDVNTHVPTASAALLLPTARCSGVEDAVWRRPGPVTRVCVINEGVYLQSRVWCPGAGGSGRRAPRSLRPAVGEPARAPPTLWLGVRASSPTGHSRASGSPVSLSKPCRLLADGKALEDRTLPLLPIRTETEAARPSPEDAARRGPPRAHTAWGGPRAVSSCGRPR